METESLIKGSLFVIIASLIGLLLFMDYSPTAAYLAEASFDSTLSYENEAWQVMNSGQNLDTYLKYLGKKKNLAAQEWGMKNFIEAAGQDLEDLSKEDKYQLNNFIIYGTPSTWRLLPDQRWQKIKGYRRKYGAYPRSYEDWLLLLAGIGKNVYNSL